jgi:YidC/Oxa1 family membrane protein insertase
MRAIRYLAIDTLYFTVALQPPGEELLECYSAWAAPVSEINPDNRQRAQRLTDVNFVMYGDAGILEPWDAELGSGAWKRDFRIFAGPKDPGILERYGLEDARTFGWFWMFSRPLIWLLHVLYWITGGISYGIAIILLTVIVRMLMIPISRKAAINAQMMQHLTPEIRELAEKYKDQPEKRMKAQQELFARYNYNPFGGCLLMFLQLPIFLGLYRGLSVDVALRDAPLIPGLEWCSNLAGPDKLFYWGDWMPSFLASETGWLGPYFNLLPLLTIALMMIQQKMFMPPATDEQSRMMQRMMKFMMIFMGFIFFKVASGLCVYFITSSIWSIIERKMLPKPELDVAKFEARAGKPGWRGRLFSEKKPDTQAGNGDGGAEGRLALEKRRERDRERKRRLRDRN